MRSQRWYVCSLGLLGLMSLTGCGGGGSGSTSSTGLPASSQSASSVSSSGGTSVSNARTAVLKVSINWAERTRLVPIKRFNRTVNAPGSALSTKLTLAQASPDGSDFNFTINRPAALQSTTQSYTSPTQVKAGTWKLTVLTFAQADGAGPVVGRAETTVTIQEDGSGIGDITMTGTVASVVVSPVAALTPGQKIQLGFAAYDSSNGLLPLTPGSAHFTVVSGGDKISLSADGLLSASAPGTATVTATIDGKVSTALNITINSPSPVGTPPVLSSANWSSFRGDAHNTGRGTGSGATGTIAWKNTYPFTVIARNPIVGKGGTLYLWTTDTTFSALDPSTGNTIWTFTNHYAKENGGADAVLSADGQIVYVPGGDAIFYALNTTDGSVKWSTKVGNTSSQTQSFFQAPALGADGTVYIGGASLESILYALDGTTGSIKWTFSANGIIAGTAAVGTDGTVYVPSYIGGLYALDPTNGQPKWVFALPSDTAIRITTPAIGDDGTLYVCAVGCYAINAATGKQKWYASLNVGQTDAPTIGKDGTIYVGNAQEFIALDGGSGSTKWHLSHNQGISPSCAVGLDGTLYTSDSATLCARDSTTGQIKWSLNIPTCGSPILASDGSLYVFGADNSHLYLYAIH